MHAYLHSARLAPKKANLMARMVRGKSVPDAMELLRNTSKKSARLFENVLRSAIANAQHNFKQDAQTMIVKTVVVNQGTAYRRGLPKARGSVRPIRKFLCHIAITLGHPGMDTPAKSQKMQKSQKKDSAPVATSVAKPAKKAVKKSSESSASSASPASSK